MHKIILVFSLLFIFPLFAEDQEIVHSRRFRSDMSKIDVDIYAAPLKFQTLYNLRDITYGIKLTNFKDSKKGLKFEVYFDYEFKGSKVYDPFSNKEVILGQHKSTLLYDINRIYKNFTYFLMVDYKRTRYGDIHPIQRRLGWGILGVKYDFYESESIPDFSLSYVPLFENEVYERSEGDTIREDHVNHLRHSIRFRFEWKITPRLSLSEQLFYRPLYDYRKNKHDFNDNLLENVTQLSYQASDRLKLSVRGTYTHDIRQRRLYGFNPTNFETEFFIDYKLKFEFLERWRKGLRDSIRDVFKDEKV